MLDRDVRPNQVRIEPSAAVPGHGGIGIEGQRLLDQSGRHVEIADDRVRGAEHREHQRIVVLQVTRQPGETQPLGLGLVERRRPVVDDVLRLTPCRQREGERIIRLDRDGPAQVIQRRRIRGSDLPDMRRPQHVIVSVPTFRPLALVRSITARMIEDG